MWKNRKVLITGATGLLGGHLTDRLIDLNSDVTTIVRDFIDKSWYVNNIFGKKRNEVDGDIIDFNLVNRVINEYQIQTVFHLAAQTQVGVANKNPIPTLMTNIIGTINILEASRINNVEQVVIASSDKAYGSSPKLPYDEETPLRGLHPYDVSKSCADLIAQTYANTYKMNVGITRCGNLFGPGDFNFNRLIPGTIQSLLNNEAPIIRSDGRMIRDYFYVKDAVEAYLLLTENLHGDIRPKIYNFSYGQWMSVLDMVHEIQRVMDCFIPPKILNRTTHEIYAQYLDSSKARTALGWKPKWTLEEALKETIEWYKENL